MLSPAAAKTVPVCVMIMNFGGEKASFSALPSHPQESQYSSINYTQ